MSEFHDHLTTKICHSCNRQVILLTISKKSNNAIIWSDSQQCSYCSTIHELIHMPASSQTCRTTHCIPFLGHWPSDILGLCIVDKTYVDHYSVHGLFLQPRLSITRKHNLITLTNLFVFLNGRWMSKHIWWVVQGPSTYNYVEYPFWYKNIRTLKVWVVLRM